MYACQPLASVAGTAAQGIGDSLVVSSFGSIILQAPPAIKHGLGASGNVPIRLKPARI